MRRLIACTVAAAALVVLSPSSARGESFVILPGTFSVLAFDHEGDLFRFVGEGFEIADRDFGVSIPRTIGQMCELCRPGDMVDPSFSTPDDGVLLGDGTGTATIRGTSYANLTYRGWFDVGAKPFEFPSIDDPAPLLATPFEFTGFIRGFSGDEEVFSGDLTGAGTAYVPYFLGQHGYEWEEGGLDYLFDFPAPAPVPEPATMLLFGSGLAGLLAARRRRTRPE